MAQLSSENSSLVANATVVLLLVLGVTTAYASGWPAPDYEAMQKAFHEGELSGKEYVEIVVTGIWQREALAEEWLTERTTRGPCLTMTVKEIREIAEQDSDANQIFGESRWRPDMQDTVQSPDGLFSIHYDTAGSHAVYQPGVDVDPADGIPDFVNRCAEAFDYVWHIEVDSLGYDPPSSDYGLGGSDNYDIYMYDNGWWGMEFAEGPAPDYPERPRAWYGHIFVNPTFNFASVQHDSCRIPALRITAAHEFQHAIQDIYDYLELKAWMEQTAVLMENVVFDETYCCAAYWVLLEEFFQNPHWYLYRYSFPFSYGACVWPFYLEHTLGIDIMRQTWVECIPTETNAIEALEIVLQERGTSHTQETPELRVWNYFTGDRDDGYHYEEGGLWLDTIHIMAEHTDFPVIDAMPIVSQRPQGYACNYIEFPELDGIDHLRITFSDENAAVRDWAVNFILWDTESSEYLSMPVENETGEIIVYPEDASTVVMIPAMLTNTVQVGQNYSYSVYGNECLLSGETVSGELVLTWEPREGAAAYWVYGADNQAHFEPGSSPGFEHRLDVLGSDVTTWSSANGICDPDHNWTYLVMAVSAMGQELMRSNRVGEWDFGAEIP